MSRFYGSMQGSKGEATRQGTAKSGITGHIRGWHIGGRVIMSVNEKDEDVVSLTVTHGSNGGGQSLCLGTFVLRNGEIVKL